MRAKARHLLLYLTLSSALILAANMALLPDYRVTGGCRYGTGSYTESTIRVQVYKGLFDGDLSDTSAEEHYRVNGAPDKLIIKLYVGKWQYRTSIYETDEKRFQAQK